MKLRLIFLDERFRRRMPSREFLCNICGKKSVSPEVRLHGRETPSCSRCGSNRRFRSIIAALSLELFGEIVPLSDFSPSKKITGIGLSDWEGYAVLLSRKFSYTNTFYHKSPRLDITSTDDVMKYKADFIICSDVLEHVPPPVDTAFTHLFQILKPGGICVFSVPYCGEGDTVEHFPGLFDYRIIQEDNRFVLENTTREGRMERYHGLRFHGGGGATLECRVFSESSLLENIRSAGFSQITIHGEDLPRHGILMEGDATSHVITMRKNSG